MLINLKNNNIIKTFLIKQKLIYLEYLLQIQGAVYIKSPQIDL